MHVSPTRTPKSSGWWNRSVSLSVRALERRLIVQDTFKTGEFHSFFLARAGQLLLATGAFMAREFHHGSGSKCRQAGMVAKQLAKMAPLRSAQATKPTDKVVPVTAATRATSS